MTEKEATDEVGLRPMISMSDVLQRIPISRSTLDRLIKEGSFPKPFYLTPMKLGFFLDEVVQWQQQLLSAAGACRPDYQATFRKVLSR